jgi:hypothetical protein
MPVVSKKRKKLRGRKVPEPALFPRFEADSKERRKKQLNLWKEIKRINHISAARTIRREAHSTGRNACFVMLVVSCMYVGNGMCITGAWL